MQFECMFRVRYKSLYQIRFRFQILFLMVPFIKCAWSGTTELHKCALRAGLCALSVILSPGKKRSYDWFKQEVSNHHSEM